ncbi:hypothetical protein HYU17_02935 [Candidatus Woesearchaeota archaeon]|nr:hypothetical protein [Candidatus Woesearchaeota archaeon]
MENQPVRAVIVDCVNVCLEDGQRKALPILEKLVGVNADALEAALGGDLRKAYTTGRLTSEEYWTAAIGDILRRPPIDVLESVAALRGVKRESLTGLGCLEAVINEQYTPIREVLEVLIKLQKAGYMLGMISNTSTERANYWQAHFPEIFKLFGPYKLFSSMPPQVRKPEGQKALFGVMAAYMGLPPNKMLYVDDKLQNVEAAIDDAGVARGVLLSTGPQLLQSEREDERGNPEIIVATYGTFEKALRDDCGLRF